MQLIDKNSKYKKVKRFQGGDPSKIRKLHRLERKSKEYRDTYKDIAGKGTIVTQDDDNKALYAGELDEVTVKPSNYDKGKRFGKEVINSTNETGKQMAPILGGMMIAPFAIGGMAANIPATIGGMIGDAATQGIVRGTTKYDSWGDMLHDKTGLHPFLAELVNPGAWAGGIAAKPVVNGVKSVASKVVPKKRFNISTGSTTEPPISEGEVPIALMMGKKEARDVLNHPVIRETNLHNRKLAKRISKVDIFGEGVTDARRDLVNRPMNESELVVNAPDKPWGARLVKREGQKDIVQLNTGIPQTFNEAQGSLFHEVLHHGYYGEAPKGFSDRMNRFYKWKTSKLYMPEEDALAKAAKDSEFSLEHYKYLTQDVGEGLTNALHLGRELGLEIGQKYPGANSVLNMLMNYKGNLSHVIKSFDLSTTPHVKRVWDAMTGRYVLIPITGATILNSRTNEGQGI